MSDRDDIREGFIPGDNVVACKKCGLSYSAVWSRHDPCPACGHVTLTLRGELEKAISKYRREAEMHREKGGEYFKGFATAQNLFVAHLERIIKEFWA